MTARTDRFGGCTVELRVPDFRAGVEFYLRLFGRRPDFEPQRDFVEWEVFDDFWSQLGEGTARPAHPLRFRVENTLGFYQRLFVDEPRVPGGSFHDFES
jgi:hypothetical protein